MASVGAVRSTVTRKSWARSLVSSLRVAVPVKAHPPSSRVKVTVQSPLLSAVVVAVTPGSSVRQRVTVLPAENKGVRNRSDILSDRFLTPLFSLRQAINKGYKDAERLKKDPDLDPLHHSADSQKLLAELETGLHPGVK